ncbi:hypothetical protein CUMW_223100 [Citrus unshiu]|uniref:Uncharacterized protein n=1 Tax=Citrus unshiu TaxID=55188 RepID=A0A2H5QEU2_CITUN|nr:hypothetical protein CUMW_223100 [Citrus unshiu]
MTPQDAAVELAVEQIVVGEESMLDQVWRCTTDQEKNRGIIGLYGTGKPNLDKIQDAIGKRIALSEESWKDKKANGKIEVKCLVHNEAWRLFQEKVGSATLRCHSDIPELVQTSAREYWSATSIENNWLSHVLQKET